MSNKNSSPLVSVIINFLNTERFIDEAIQSVFSQTYQNWELLLIDDGSAEAATKIAKTYQEKHPEGVRYLEHPGHENRGASASRNLGIWEAKGKYVAFLDSDDMWLPTKLKTQVEVLEAKPEVAMVYGPGLWWYSWSGHLDEANGDYVQNIATELDAVVPSGELLAIFLKNEDSVPSASAVMVKTNVIRNIGGSEEECKSVYDDQVIYAKINLIAPVFITDDGLYRYRQHPEQRCSISANNGEYQSIRLDYLKWLLGYISSQDLNNSKIKKVVKSEINALDPSFGPKTEKVLRQVFWRLSRTTRWFLPASVRKQIWQFIQKSHISEAK